MLSYLFKTSFMTCFVCSDVSGLTITYLGLTGMCFFANEIFVEYKRDVMLKSRKNG